MAILLQETQNITDLILRAAEKARAETSGAPEPETTQPPDWPITCTVGPGLEGAIACSSKVGYVNGTKGWLIYRGYDIFDLCAYSTFEEVSYLLLHGELPTARELAAYKRKLTLYRNLQHTIREMMGYEVESLNTMAALRLGTLFMRRHNTYLDLDTARPDIREAIGSDEDSIPMETKPVGERHAIYEFQRKMHAKPKSAGRGLRGGEGLESCYRLLAGVVTITGAIARLRAGRLPLEPNPDLSHAASLLYMMTGRMPTPVEERVMDVCLILHADHGMNASTFAAMVVASTLSDVFFSAGAGIAALNGPLHGGANEQVIYQLEEIGSARRVKHWLKKTQAAKGRVMGFGHRVYKAYDPRARVLGPLADFLVRESNDQPLGNLLHTAQTLEAQVLATFGQEKKIFPNVDFYSGIVYRTLGVPPQLYTPIFAVSRVAGWTARVLEYLQENRIFRPRAIYTGAFDKHYVPIQER